MKKITLLFLLTSLSLIAQEYDSGVVNLGSQITARVQTNASTVTLTVTGPSDRWFSVGFGTNGMSSGDCLVFTNSGISDRNFSGYTTPPTDVNDWTLVSNTVVSGIRTIVGTRALISPNPTGDYAFSNSPSSISVVWAHDSSSSQNLAYHGNSRGNNITINTTLNNEAFLLNSFVVYPNPVNDGILKINLPDSIEEVSYTIYEMTGKVVLEGNINNISNSINVSDLSTGNYIINFKNDNNTSASKTFIIQ